MDLTTSLSVLLPSPPPSLSLSRSPCPSCCARIRAHTPRLAKELSQRVLFTLDSCGRSSIERSRRKPTSAIPSRRNFAGRVVSFAFPFARGKRRRSRSVSIPLPTGGNRILFRRDRSGERRAFFSAFQAAEGECCRVAGRINMSGPFLRFSLAQREKIDDGSSSRFIVTARTNVI